MILEKGAIIPKPIETREKKWGKAFEKMHKNNDDRLLFHDVFEDENFEEWN
jgi:antitoxin MazE